MGLTTLAAGSLRACCAIHKCCVCARPHSCTHLWTWTELNPGHIFPWCHSLIGGWHPHPDPVLPREDHA